MLRDHRKNFIKRRCLSSYTSEYMLMLHKPKGGNNGVTTIRTSSESLPYSKDHFHKNSLNFRIYADLEADNEIDNLSIGNKKS